MRELLLVSGSDEAACEIPATPNVATASVTRTCRSRMTTPVVSDGWSLDDGPSFRPMFVRRPATLPGQVLGAVARLVLPAPNAGCTNPRTEANAATRRQAAWGCAEGVDSQPGGAAASRKHVRVRTKPRSAGCWQRRHQSEPQGGGDEAGGSRPGGGAATTRGCGRRAGRGLVRHSVVTVARAAGADSSVSRLDSEAMGRLFVRRRG